ncbi:response regulator [Balneatrix alpica]|uniref:Response regulator n=1 Tax=Balneatrix alpica TaxID=75684 RepID=A0ABV5Z958_9GAMM|nr:response regulator [Balneatrix alpica]
MAGKRVLVVDDTPSIRVIERSVLKNLGFDHVAEAEDGDQALKYLQNNPVDLVICDWDMPKLSGLELLKAIRKDKDLKKTKFIMLTGLATKDLVTEAIKAGVNEYIVKPFSASILEEKIKSLGVLDTPKSNADAEASA